jgi:hypothetical protein
LTGEVPLPDGFIKKFVEWLTSRVPFVNRDYVTLIAEATLAGVSFNARHYNRIGVIPLAIWGLGITRSGEYKTVPLRDYAIPVMNAVQKRIKPSGKVIKRILLPSAFSPEGLIEMLMVHDEEVYDEATGQTQIVKVISNEGIMIRDEFTSLVKGVKTKEWLSDVSERLSEVYDGRISPYYTKKSKRQEVAYCNVSFIAATTPYFYTLLDETFFIQGLGNRLDYVVWDPPEDLPEIKPEEFFGIPWQRDRDLMIEEFANDLYGVLSSPLRFVDIDPTSEAAKMWVEYRHEIELRKRKLPSRGLSELKWSYLARQAEKALRRACLYCISRNIKALPRLGKLDTLIINEKDMELAIKRQEKYYEYFETLLNRWIAFPQPRGPAQTDMADLERMLAILANSPYKIMTNSQWLKESGYGFRNKFYELKRHLIDAGEVEELGEEEVKKLPPEVKKWLEIDRPDKRVKVYRLSRKYFIERGMEPPW